MKVKQRLGINSVVTIATVFIILLMFFLGLYEVKKAVIASKVTDELIISALERSTFRSDYLRTGSERAKNQWFAKHEQMGTILKSASEVFRDTEDLKTIQNLIKDHETTGKIFSGIVESREKPKPDASSAALAQEKEDRLTAQLEIRLYDKILLVRTLRDSAENRLSSVFTLAGMGIICGLAILMATAIFNSWTMGRAITDRIKRLSVGVSMIGGGDLDYRIDVKGDDELSELADAFNAMSAKLKRSYQDLEKEIETRKQAEESLHKMHDELEVRVHQRTKELKEAIEAVEAERQRFFGVLETLPSMIRLLTPDYHIAFANRSFREKFGESEGRHCYDYCFGRTEPCEFCESFQVLKTGRPHHWEFTSPDGSILDAYDFPFTDTDGSLLILEMDIDITEQRQAQKALRELNETLEQRITERTSELQASNESLRASRVAALNLMEDALAARKRAEEASDELRREITARIRAEKELRESEERLRLHGENSPTAIIEWDAGFIVTRWAGEAEHIFGWSAAETVGKPIMDLHLIYEEDIPIVEQTMGKLTDGVSRKVVSGNRNYTKDGRVIHCEWYNSVLYDAGGKMTSVMSQVLDITERKQAEEALRESQERLRFALETIHVGAWDLDLVDHRAFRSLEHDRIFGYTQPLPEWTYEMFLEHVVPEDRATVDGKFRRAMENQSDWNSECRIRRLDGQVRWVWAAGRYAQDTAGASRRMAGIVQDITERKQMEVALRENLEHLHLAHDAAHSGTWEWDVRTDENTWSDEVWALYGLQPQSVEPSYEAWKKIVHPDDRQRAERVVQKAVREGAELNVEFRVKGLDETEHWLMSRAQPLRDSRGQVVRYIGVLMDITERRRFEESIRMLAYIVESSDDAIISKTLGGIITSWNRGAEKMYGYSKDEVIGKPISILAPPELKDEMVHILEKIRERSPIEHIESLRVTKDGRTIHVSLSVSPIHDAEDKVIGASTIARDISDRKRMEDEVFNLLAELERSNKDLEQFAYVASHDLQEPLRMVSSYTQLLARRYKDKLDQDAKDYIEFAANGANRMQRLIKDLLLYSRVTTRGAAPVPVDMKVVLGEAKDNLQVAIKETGALVTNNDLPVVAADHTQLVQVLQNLIGNAVKFRGETPPRIHISAEKTGGDWKISIQDNGIGIEPQYFERIFVIFQRLHTADKYQGTGIGLALCKRIVQRLGGNMWVESEPGQGSTFYFTLKGVE
jgi:PAS domain S-box-containing protein